MDYKTAKRIYKKLNKQCKKNYIENLLIICGPNIVLQIDESEFCKRKFERDHYVEGIWVLGM